MGWGTQPLQIGVRCFGSEDNADIKLGICISHDVVLSKAYSPVAPMGLGCWLV